MSATSDGSAPDGSVPDGSVPDGSVPDGSVPDGSAPDGSALEAFAEQMRVLRRECAWKREQTHTSLIPFVREEAEEVVEAIESGDPAALCDELGDLLLQVVIHAVIAEEAGDFTLDDVARGVIAKMERRNPHVFGDAVATDAAEVLRLWNAAKAAEKAGKAEGVGPARGASRPQPDTQP